MSVLVSGVFGHGVQRAAVLEPLDLAVVKGVVQGHVEDLAAVRWVEAHSDGFASGKFGGQDVDAVVWVDLVVVGRVGEREGQHALFLQVGFVLHGHGHTSSQLFQVMATWRRDSKGVTYNSGKASGDDGQSTQVSRFQSGVFS